MFEKIKDFLKTTDDSCVHPFGSPYFPCEVCKQKVGTVSSGFPMPKCKPPKLMSDYLIPKGCKFIQYDSKYLEDIQAIIVNAKDGTLIPNNGESLPFIICEEIQAVLDMRNELIQEILDERNK